MGRTSPRLFRALFWVLLFPCFFSCARLQGKLLILEGNFFFSRGLYIEAIASYLKAGEYAEAIPYAEYGLGSVYFSLDEGEAALERFRAAEKALGDSPGEEHGELVYRLRYNRGVVLFGEGDFQGAAEAFRAALERDGSRIEAKRNLELSLLALGQRRNLRAPENFGPGREEAEPETEILFDYLRRKEREQWESREWAGETPSPGPDY